MPHGHIGASTSRLRVYLFLLPASPGHLHYNAVSAIPDFHWVAQNRFHLYPLACSPVQLYAFLRFRLVLSASLFSCSRHSSTSVLYVPNVSAGIISPWFPPIPFHNFSTTLSHPLPALPFWNFLPYSCNNHGWQPLFWHIPLLHVAI